MASGGENGERCAVAREELNLLAELLGDDTAPRATQIPYGD